MFFQKFVKPNLHGRTFSLGHLLIDSIPGGVITFAHGDREAIAVDDRDGVRRRRLLRWLLRRKITSRYQTLVWRVPKHLLRQSTGGVLIRDGHASFPIGSGATVMVKLV